MFLIIGDQMQISQFQSIVAHDNQQMITHVLGLNRAFDFLYCSHVNTFQSIAAHDNQPIITFVLGFNRVFDSFLLFSS
jgi:hypothetical protein